MKIDYMRPADWAVLEQRFPAAFCEIRERCLRGETRHLAAQPILTADEYARLKKLAAMFPEEVASNSRGIYWLSEQEENGT